MKELHKKLVTIQTELKAPKNQFNSFGKYKYRNIEDIQEAVKPHLLNHGLALTFTDKVSQVGDMAFIESTATISDGEHSLSTSASAGVEPRKGMDLAQTFGASSSYARKYAAGGLFLLDDTKDADATNTHGQEEIKPSINLISWKEEIGACKTIEELRNLYKEKESIIANNKEVMNLFNTKKLTFTKTIQ